MWGRLNQSQSCGVAGLWSHSVRAARVGHVRFENPFPSNGVTMKSAETQRKAPATTSVNRFFRNIAAGCIIRVLSTREIVAPRNLIQ